MESISTAGSFAWHCQPTHKKQGAGSDRNLKGVISDLELGRNLSHYFFCGDKLQNSSRKDKAKDFVSGEEGTKECLW